MTRLDASPTDMANALRNKMRTVFSMSGQNSANVRTNKHRQSTDLGHLRDSASCGKIASKETPMSQTKKNLSTQTTAQRSLAELDLCIRYQFEVVRTGKTQMLSSSCNAIVDVLLQLISAVEHDRRVLQNTTQIITQHSHTTNIRKSPLMKQLYKDVVRLLQWVDRQVMSHVIDDEVEEPNASSSRQVSTDRHQQQIQQITSKLRSTCQSLIDGHTEATSDRVSLTSSNSSSSVFNGMNKSVDMPDSRGEATLTRSDSKNGKQLATRQAMDMADFGNTPIILSERDTKRKTDERALRKASARETMKLNTDGSKVHETQKTVQNRQAKHTATTTSDKSYNPINLAKNANGEEDIWQKVKSNREANEELVEESEEVNDESTEQNFSGSAKSASNKSATSKKHSTSKNTSETTTSFSTNNGSNHLALGGGKQMLTTGSGTQQRTSSSSKSSSSRMVCTSSSSTSKSSSSSSGMRSGQWTSSKGTGDWPPNIALTHINRLPIIGGPPAVAPKPTTSSGQTSPLKSGRPTNVDEISALHSQVALKGRLGVAFPGSAQSSCTDEPDSQGRASHSNDQWREHVNEDGSRILVKVTDEIQAMKHTGVTDEFEKKASTMDGKVIAMHEGQTSTGERSALALKQEAVNGQVVDRQGGVLQQKYIDESEDRKGGNQPPPLPPRRQHVATYMKLFASDKSGNGSSNGSGGQDEYAKRRSANMRRQESMDNKHGGDMEACRATLSIYLMLRDNLTHYENNQFPDNAQRYGSRLGLISSSQSTSDIHQSNNSSNLSPQAADYTSLRTLLEFGEDDTLRLPLTYFTTEGEEETEQLGIGWHTRLAICEGADDTTPPTKVDILTLSDVRDYMIIRSNHKQLGEVRGGPLLAIIAHCTQPDVTHLLYQEAFITTYRTFISASDVLTALVRRYDHFSSQREGGDNTSQRRSIARHSFAVITRIVDEIAACELTTSLMTTVTQFIYRLLNDGELGQARLLRQRFTAKLDDKMLSATSPLCNKRNSVMTNETILDLKSKVIADQMTFLDSKMFKKIDLSEMLKWAEKQDEKACPNLVNFTEQFNKVSYWVRTAVLRPNDKKEREKYYQKFIKVMRHLRLLGNYNSYLAVLSALDSGAVRRLPWSRDLVDAMAEHTAIMDSAHSFRNYRNALALTRPPCLPYIGLILQDLTFIHVGNSSYLPAHLCNDKKDMLNFGKRWQQFAILDAVRKFKNWSYNLEKVDKVQKVLNLDDHYNDDEAWLRSETLKPRHN